MRRIITISVLCAAILPVAAYAEGHAEGHADAHAEGHAANFVSVSASTLTSGPSSTGAAIAVGHRYNEHLAIEVAYDDAGALKAAPERTTAFSVAAIGSVPFNANFEGYVRLGYASAHTKGEEGATANHGDITYGFGVEYRVNGKYSVGLGWNRIRIGDNIDIPRANENSYALSVVRSF